MLGEIANRLGNFIEARRLDRFVDRARRPYGAERPGFSRGKNAKK
jgi:hypothetical protein